MSHELINFQIRAQDDASLAEMVSRIEQALKCQFIPSNAKEFQGTEAVETEVLGIQITLTYWPALEDREVRNYWLTGNASEDIMGSWENVTDVSKFILLVLTQRDKGKWYIPGKEEILAEAGLA